MRQPKIEKILRPLIKGEFSVTAFSMGIFEQFVGLRIEREKQLYREFEPRIDIIPEAPMYSKHKDKVLNEFCEAFGCPRGEYYSDEFIAGALYGIITVKGHLAED